MTENALIKFEEMTPADIFKPDMMDKIIAQVAEKAREHTPDLSTATSRKAIASVAAKVASSKTFLDAQGKALVEPLKEQAKLIDAERKKMRDALSALKDEVRAPLTKWEEEEKDRQERAREKLAWLRGLPQFSITDMDASHIQALIDDAEAAIISIDTFGDLNDQAENAKLVAIDALKIKLEERKQWDQDQKDLAEFRERKAAEEKARQEQERKALAEEAKKRAEDARKKQEEERAKREEQIREEAAEAERRRIAEEQAKLAADEAHRVMVIDAAIASLSDYLEPGLARKVIGWIEDGKVANVIIQY